MSEWLPEDEPLWYWPPRRVIPLLVGFGYLVAAFFLGNGEIVASMVGFLILPLACIWFPEPIGDFTGSTGSGSIDKASPEDAVSVAGWTLLFLPIVVSILV